MITLPSSDVRVRFPRIVAELPSPGLAVVALVPSVIAVTKKKYTIIIHTAKARHDRGFVDGKSGTQLIWEWLEKHDLSQYISKVTSEKPRAVAYIDDKSIKFSNWDEILEKVENLEN